MQRIEALILVVVATGAFAGCGYPAHRTVTSTTYIPGEETVTTTQAYSPVYLPPADAGTSQIVTTVTHYPDGTVTRTSTRYYNPPARYTYYNSDDATLAAQVRSTMRQDPLVSAHTRNLAIGSDAGIVAITGRADSISTVQQASWDALQVPGVTRVNNDMMIDPASPG
jgi:limonene-1,2-epoxide hydrolase